ncbi:MAG: enoyl-CoA hydratase-related protein [Sphingobium sp.]|nr:enoyl-CoA hydratase-related protein [Sphingobium sp.]
MTEVTVSRDGAVATITFNRPDQFNAIDQPFAQALLAAAIEVDQDEAVRCVVMTGAGRMFCAGGDITLMQSSGDRLGAALSELAGTLHLATSRLARMDKPLLCAVNGPAAGAGLGLAIMGDIVIAGASAHFTPGYPGIGLTPDGGATWLLPRLIGLRRAQEMLLTNQRIGAEEAATIGLVTRTVADEALADEVAATAARLAAAATGAIGTVRAQLLASYGAGLETQLEAEARGIAAAGSSPDGREGVAAFLQKRRPDFTGRR